MADRKDSYIQDPNTLREEVQEIIRRIHDEADPHEMNAYKRFIKKNVSIFSRSYFTAYLVKEFVEGKTERRPRSDADAGTSNRRGRRGGRANQANDARGENNGGDREDRKKRDKSGESPVGNVAPEDRKTLFVSVGKNRRVYPKDFVALFAELDGVEGDDIGQIKILDNYSFVEVDERVAEVIIAAYDGYEFRGRKLTVNHARNKKD